MYKSNKWDAAKDVLLVSKRLENLEDYHRKPRKYTKRNSEYWETAIKEKRSILRKHLQIILKSKMKGMMILLG